MIRKRNYDLLFPLDFSGTLCARDGIKTGPHSPNGEDAYDRKLVVMRMKRKRKFFSNHQSTSDVQEVDVAPCMGASRNLGPSNNNPLVVTCFSGPQDHSVTRGFIAAAGMSGNNRPFIVKSRERHTFQETGKAYCMQLGAGSTLRVEGENRPSRPSNVILDKGVKRKRRAVAVLDRCGNNWKNGKGGCGPLLHDEYAPTVATMFLPFVISEKIKKPRNEV